MADDLENTIRENAAGPKQASADGVSTQQHSLSELIDTEMHLAGKGALAKKNFGMTRGKIISPGTA